MSSQAQKYSCGVPKKIHYKVDGKDQKNESASPLVILKNLVILGVIILIFTGATTSLLILYICVQPFSKRTYRRVSCKLLASFYDATSLILPNMKIYLSGDSDPISPIGVSVLVCNHSVDSDWWAMLMLARCVGLRGSLKAFLQHKSSAVSKSPSQSNHDISTSNNSNSAIPMSASAPILNATLPCQGFIGGGVSMSKMIRNHSQQSVNFANLSSNPHSSNCGAQSEWWNQCLATTFLNKFLEFPLLSSENTQNYVQDRNELFSLLRSFASSSVNVPTHLLLFPEGWPEGQDRRSMIKKSVEFAKREGKSKGITLYKLLVHYIHTSHVSFLSLKCMNSSGRPQLKHLLLPRTTGFYASLDSLREASPVVYDVTMAYRGYNGERPFTWDSSFDTLLRLIRGETPNEIHVRIKRFSMGEVLSDPNWLDKQWIEKDRLLEHFERHGTFPVDNRGYSRHIIMDTKSHSVESSLMALFRLGLVPFAIPIILLLAVPILFSLGWIWVAHKTFIMLFPGGFGDFVEDIGESDGHVGKRGGNRRGASMSNNDGGTDSTVGTPFCPATPFASPTQDTWRSAPTINETSKNQKRR